MRAFTLLEMAIVIAIIGLLAGGIVAGQSYLRSARMTSMVNDAKYYMSAFNQFETKYSAVPGDMSTASGIWSTANNGDGNGLVAQGGSVNEYYYLFDHLSKAGLIGGTYTGVAGSSGANQMVPGSNIPSGDITDLGYWFTDLTTSGYFVSGSSTYFDGYYMHPLRTGLRITGNYAATDPFLSTQEAMQIDGKYDDGLPGTGWVRGPTNGASGASTCSTSTTASSAAYDITATGKPCWLVFTAQ